MITPTPQVRMRDHGPLINSLQRALDAAASPQTRTWWERYLRGAIPFRGVPMAGIRDAVSRWRADHDLGAWDAQAQFDLALRLFEEPAAEDKLAGMFCLERYVRTGAEIPWPAALDRYGALYRGGHINDWNTSDWFCVRVLGPAIAANGPACAEAVCRWTAAEPLWQARSGVVAFVPVASESRYHPLILEGCATLIRRAERFAKTGVGWILRDVWKVDPPSVLTFLDAHLPAFSLEALRNALKYADAATRARYLAGRKLGRR